MLNRREFGQMVLGIGFGATLETALGACAPTQQDVYKAHPEEQKKLNAAFSTYITLTRGQSSESPLPVVDIDADVASKLALPNASAAGRDNAGYFVYPDGNVNARALNYQTDRRGRIETKGGENDLIQVAVANTDEYHAPKVELTASLDRSGVLTISGIPEDSTPLILVRVTPATVASGSSRPGPQRPNPSRRG